KPPYYQGKEVPNLLEKWIRNFDKLFESIRCPKEERIHAAIYYLQGEADIWWSTSQADLIAQPDFNWDAYKTAMRDRFYPEHVKMQNFDDFATLRQRNITVQEFRSKFLELSRFPPTMVLDEQSKASKFIESRRLILEENGKIEILGMVEATFITMGVRSLGTITRVRVQMEVGLEVKTKAMGGSKRDTITVSYVEMTTQELTVKENLSNVLVVRKWDIVSLNAISRRMITNKDKEDEQLYK
ncbi:cytochrome c oxidase subunit 1, partial [Bienertia sinuspersici]